MNFIATAAVADKNPDFGWCRGSFPESSWLLSANNDTLNEKPLSPPGCYWGNWQDLLQALWQDGIQWMSHFVSTVSSKRLGSVPAGVRSEMIIWLYLIHVFECLIDVFDLERTRTVGFCWKVVAYYPPGIDTISELKALKMTSSSKHFPGLDIMLMHWCDVM